MKRREFFPPCPKCGSDAFTEGHLHPSGPVFVGWEFACVQCGAELEALYRLEEIGVKQMDGTGDVDWEKV